MAEINNTYKKLNFVNGSFAVGHLDNFVNGKMRDLETLLRVHRYPLDDVKRFNDMQVKVDSLEARAYNCKYWSRDKDDLQRVSDDIYRFMTYSLLPLLQKYEEAPASTTSPVDDAPLVLEGERAIETDEEPEGYGEVDDFEPGAAYAPGAERVGETESE